MNLLKLSYLALAIIMYGGILLPYLISSNSNELVLLGILSVPVVIYGVVKTVVKV